MRVIAINPIHNFHNQSKVLKATHTNNEIKTQNNEPAFGHTIPYFVNFKGYKEDDAFLQNASELFDNVLTNVEESLNSKFNPEENEAFFKALEVLKKDAPQMYEKLFSSAPLMKNIQSAFGDFDKTTLASVDEVRCSSKIFSSYWQKNSLIGETKTLNIIQDSLNAQSLDINHLIKKASAKDYLTIKNSLIKSWFKEILESVPSEKISEENLKLNCQKLSQLKDANYTKNFVLQQKNELYKSFNNNTKEKIQSFATNTEQKTNSFKLMLSYFESKLLNDTGDALQRDYDNVYTIKNILSNAKEKESLVYAMSGIKQMHAMAFEQWEKQNLNSTINNKLEKEIYSKESENKNPKLLYFQNYTNFDTDEKYFVSKYFETKYNYGKKYNFDDKDYLLQIINDRNNTKTPKQTIKEISIKLDQDKKIYFSQLDSFSDLLQERANNDEALIPERRMENPYDKMTFADVYISKMEKMDKFKRSSETEKLNYLSSLTDDEFAILNESIKADWLKNEFPYALLAEVSREANKISVFTNMYDELKKINLNLDEIKIKTGEISQSLKMVVENQTLLISKLDENSKEKVVGTIIEMENTYHSMTPEQKIKAEKEIGETLPSIIDSVISQQKDPQTIKQLMGLKEQCVKKTQGSMQRTFDFMKNMLISRSILGGFSGGKSYLTNRLTSSSAIGAQDLVSPDAMANAASGLSSGGLLSTLGTAAASNPVTATIAAVVVVVSAAAIMGKCATSLERKQRDLVFEF